MIGELKAIHTKIFLSNLFSIALIACGTYQAILAMLQLYGFKPSRHYLYAFTGTFLNPGPFCGYVAFILPLALDKWFVWRERTLPAEKIVCYLFGMICLLFIILLPAGMSRAAWLSASISSLYVISKRFPCKIRRPLLLGAAAVAGLLFLAASVLLLHFKENSARRRLLIWKITTEMIADKPLTGYGAASFSSKYMDAQESYFHSHPHAVGGMYPHYLLAKLYCEKDYYYLDAAKKEAEIVLYRDPKVMSSAVKEMRYEMGKIISIIS